MSSTDTIIAATTHHARGGPAGWARMLLNVIRSEWTKLWSLRSTGWSLAAMLLVSVGFSALASWGAATHLRQTAAHSGGSVDPTNITLSGLLFGQLAIAVLGVLGIGGEYSTGAIRSSLTAVPGRIRLLTGKLVVFTTVAFLAGTLTSVLSFFTGMVFFAAHHAGAGLGDPHVLRAVIGGGLLMTVCGLLGFAVGCLLRHTAGAITVSVAALFVIPIVLGAIPSGIVGDVNKYFLVVAGGGITSVIPRPDALSAWTGYLLFLAEVSALLVAGAARMLRRDA